MSRRKENNREKLFLCEVPPMLVFEFDCRHKHDAICHDDIVKSMGNEKGFYLESP